MGEIRNAYKILGGNLKGRDPGRLGRGWAYNTTDI
jgi:hypothetical protein